MGTSGRAGVAAVVLALVASAATAQEDPAAREAYHRAVGDFFDVSDGEVTILREWQLPDEEIPVVLFVARRAGVSPEALVALRRGGRSWAELAGRYRVDASHFHVPLAEGAPAGVLSDAYQRFRSTPTGAWSSITLSDAEIVALVNLRLVARTLRMPAAEVLAAHSLASSFVDLYARLLRVPERP